MAERQAMCHPLVEAKEPLPLNRPMELRPAQVGRVETTPRRMSREKWEAMEEHREKVRNPPLAKDSMRLRQVLAAHPLLAQRLMSVHRAKADHCPRTALLPLPATKASHQRQGPMRLQLAVKAGIPGKLRPQVLLHPAKAKRLQRRSALLEVRQLPRQATMAMRQLGRMLQRRAGMAMRQGMQLRRPAPRLKMAKFRVKAQCLSLRRPAKAKSPRPKVRRPQMAMQANHPLLAHLKRPQALEGWPQMARKHRQLEAMEVHQKTQWLPPRMQRPAAKAGQPMQLELLNQTPGASEANPQATKPATQRPLQTCLEVKARLPLRLVSRRKEPQQQESCFRKSPEAPLPGEPALWHLHKRARWVRLQRDACPFADRVFRHNHRHPRQIETCRAKSTYWQVEEKKGCARSGPG